MEKPVSPAARWQQDVVQETGRHVVVMIGSPSDISIHVWALQNMARAPLDLHILTSFTPAFTSKVPVDAAKGSVTWYVGDSTDQQDLQGLPLQQAACILVVAFKLDEDEPAAPTDARSLSTVFQLREMLRDEATSPAIVCELMDIRSKLVVETRAFKGTASFFHSVRVETALFATAADDTQVFNMLMLLVEPNGMDLWVVTAEQLGLFDERPSDMAGKEVGSSSPGRPSEQSGSERTGSAPANRVSFSSRSKSNDCGDDNMLDDFWTLREKIARRDPETILIGWRRSSAEDERDLDEPGEWVVNPQNKEFKFKVSRDSLFVILKCKAPDKRTSNTQSSQTSQKPVLAGVFEVPLCV